MNKCGYLGLLLIGGLLCSLPASAAKLYKWVDSEGVTHYGETIPPEYANRSRTELTTGGRVKQTTEVLTNEQRRTRAEQEAKQHEQDLAMQDQKRRDKALVNTYTNEHEIDLARDRNLQQIDARITNINFQLKQVTNKLDELQKEGEQIVQSGKKLPDSLKEDLLENNARRKRLSEDLEKAQASKTAIEAKFEADKARFKELTGK